jgi:hypothetical protein
MRRNLVLCFIVLGGLDIGCALPVDATRNLSYECSLSADQHAERRRFLQVAEQAWMMSGYASSGHPYSEDFISGFKDGFVDYLEAGGTGQPPTLPPRRYWKSRYETPDGYRAIEDWFAGFRGGAAAAHASGYRRLVVVPSAMTAHGPAAPPMPPPHGAGTTEPPLLQAPDGRPVPLAKPLPSAGEPPLLPTPETVPVPPLPAPEKAPSPEKGTGPSAQAAPAPLPAALQAAGGTDFKVETSDVTPGVGSSPETSIEVEMPDGSPTAGPIPETPFEVTIPDLPPDGGEPLPETNAASPEPTPVSRAPASWPAGTALGGMTRSPWPEVIQDLAEIDLVIDRTSLAAGRDRQALELCNGRVPSPQARQNGVVKAFAAPR